MKDLLVYVADMYAALAIAVTISVPAMAGSSSHGRMHGSDDLGSHPNTCHRLCVCGGGKPCPQQGHWQVGLPPAVLCDQLFAMGNSSATHA